MDQKEHFITAYALWAGEFVMGVKGPNVSGIVNGIVDDVFTKLSSLKKLWYINHHLSAFNRRITSRLEISTKWNGADIMLKFTDSLITLDVESHATGGGSSIRITNLEDARALELLPEMIKLATTLGKGGYAPSAVKLEGKMKKMLRDGKDLKEIKSTLKAGFLLMGY
jgi:hypothetical protein